MPISSPARDSRDGLRKSHPVGVRHPLLGACYAISPEVCRRSEVKKRSTRHAVHYCSRFHASVGQRKCSVRNDASLTPITSSEVSPSDGWNG